MNLTDEKLIEFGFTKEPPRPESDYPEQLIFTKDGFEIITSVGEGREPYFTFINGHAKFFTTIEQMIALYNKKTGNRVFR